MQAETPYHTAVYFIVAGLPAGSSQDVASVDNVVPNMTKSQTQPQLGLSHFSHGTNDIDYLSSLFVLAPVYYLRAYIATKLSFSAHTYT